MEKGKVSVIIPTMNEEKSVGLVIGEVMQVLQEMKPDHESDCLCTPSTTTVVPGEALRKSVPIDPFCQPDQFVIWIKMVLEYPFKYAILITISTGHAVYPFCVVFGDTLHRKYTSWPLFFNVVVAHFSV